MSERVESSRTALRDDADGTGVRQRYRPLVNTVDDGIYQLDADGRFVAIDDAIVGLAGCAREELRGERDSMLLDDSSAIERETERLLTDPIDQSGALEVTVQTVDGNRVRGEVLVNLLDADDTLKGPVRDITERNRTGQGVRERGQKRDRELERVKLPAE